MSVPEGVRAERDLARRIVTGQPQRSPIAPALDTRTMAGLLLRLQRTAGNQAVNQLLRQHAASSAIPAALQRCGTGSCACEDERAHGTSGSMQRVAVADPPDVSQDVAAPDTQSGDQQQDSDPQPSDALQQAGDTQQSDQDAGQAQNGVQQSAEQQVASQDGGTQQDNAQQGDQQLGGSAQPGSTRQSVAPPPPDDNGVEEEQFGDESGSAQQASDQQGGNFQVRGKFSGSTGKPNSIFFDFDSSALDAEETAKIQALATPPDRAFTLKGTVSEEGQAAHNQALADARIAAVSNAFRAAGHTGQRTPQRDLTSSSGVVEYRRLRQVECIPAGGASTQPDCSHGAEIPCGPEFFTARERAVAMVGQAKDALNAPDANTVDLLTRLRFGGASAAHDVQDALGKIATQLGNMLPAAAHRCVNSCEGDVFAYNQGTGATAVMTMGPIYQSTTDLDDRAGVLIHEGSHGADGLQTADHAYRWQRLIAQLDPQAAKSNADSYFLFVRALNNHQDAIGPVQSDAHSADMSNDEKDQVDNAVAWLEQWLVQTRLQMRETYTDAHHARQHRSWADLWDGGMSAAAHNFGLTTPPGIPTSPDMTALAAIYDRCAHMRFAVTAGPLTINKAASGTAIWEAGPGRTLTVPQDFFQLGAPARVRALLGAIVRATSDISGEMVPKYIGLINDLSVNMGSP